jgi:PAS domain S-box-containing protein
MSGSLIHVLLVEDNPADALMLQTALEADQQNTFSLTRVERLGEGIARMKQGGIDIVLLDLSLPDSQGLVTFEKFHHHHPGVPVLVFSGNTDEAAAAEAVRAGAQDYLVKSLGGFDMAGRAIRYAIERQHVQTSLRQSEERYHSILDTMMEGCQIIGFDWRYLYLNDAAARHGRRTAEELIGHTMMEMYPGIENSPSFTPLRECMEERVSRRFENEFVYPDGSQGWFELSVQPVEQGLFILSVDITERKLAEASLVHSEERHRQISSMISDFVYSGLVLPNGTVKTEWISGAFEKNTGFTLDEVNQLPAGFASLLLPEDLEIVIGQQPKFLEEKSQTVEYRIRRKDGSIRWLRDYMQIVLDQLPGGAIRISGAVQDITERKLAEQKLQENEIRFRSLIENAPGAITLVGADGKLKYVSSSTEREMGYREEETLGINPAEMTHPDDLPGLLAILDDLIKTPGKVSIAQYRFLHNDGSWRWVESTISNLLHEPAIQGIAFNFHDITERKLAEAALKRNEQVLRLFVEHTPAAIAMFDTNMRYIVTSRRYLTDYGLEQQDLTGRSHYEIFPEISEQNKDIHRRCLAGASEKADNDPFPRADGRLDWVRWQIHPWYEVTGDIGGIILFSEVITERKLAEDALKAEQIRFNQVAASVPGAITMLRVSPDGQLKLVYASKAFEDLFGLSIEVALANLDQIVQKIPPMLAEAFVSEVSQSSRTLQPWSKEFPYKHPTKGDIWLENYSTPVRESDGSTTWYGITNDVTERKLVDEALRLREADLAEAQRVAKLGSWRFDTETGHLQWSEELHRIFEIDDKEFGGIYNSFLERVHRDDQQLVLDTNRRTLATGDSFEIEYRIETGSGHLKYIREIGNASRNEAGKVKSLFGIAQDITERKRSEEALRESEERDRAMLLAIPDMMFRLNSQGVILDYKADADDLYTQDAANLIGKRNRDVTPPDFADLIDEKIALTLKTGLLQTFEYRMELPAGGVHEYEARMTPSGSDEVIAIVRDITERKQAEDRLRESEVHFRTLADSGQALIWTSGLDKQCDYFNQTWLDFTGRALEQELGYGWLDGVHPSDREWCEGIYIDAFDKRIPFDMDYRLRRFDGEYRWIQDSGKPRYNSRGEFIGYIGHCLDITDRKHSEEKIRLSEQQYRYLFENNPHPMWAYDLKTLQFLAVNDSAVEKYGYSRDEFLKMTIADIRPQEDVARLAENLSRPRTTIQHSGEWRHQLKDGRIIDVEIDSHTLNFSEREAVLVVAQDITERKQTEEQIRQRMNELEVLYESGLAIASIMDANQVAEKVIEIIGRRLEWHHAVIRMIDPQTQAIDVLAYGHSGLLESEREDHLARLRETVQKPGQGLSGWVIQHGESVLSSDVVQDARYVATLPGIRSGLYVPIKAGRYVIGSIAVESTRPAAFDEQDQRLLETISAQAAIAIENARLYLKVQKELVERQRAQVELRQNERHLRAILETTSDGFWIVDGNGAFQEVNESYLRMTGYGREEFLSLRISDIEASETQDETINHIQKVMGTGSDRFESRHRRKDGSLFDVEISVNRMDEEMVVFCHDITVRKRAEQQIRESNERFTEIANNIPDIFWIADPVTGRNTYVSPAFSSIVGLSEETVENLPGGFEDLVLPDDRHILHETHEREINGIKSEVQYRIRRPDGSIRWLRDRSSPVFDENGKVVRVVGVARDVTEQVEADMRLRDSESRFRLIADTIDEVFWMSDPAISQMLYISPAYERVWGRTQESLYENPRSFIDAILPEDRPRVLATLELQKEGKQFAHEYRIAWPDGTVRWIWDRGYPLSGESGRVDRYVGVAQDITERKWAEEQLHQRAQDLELINAMNVAVNKGDALERIAELMSAEVRKIFNCIATFTCFPDPTGAYLTVNALNFATDSLASKVEKMLGGRVPDLGMKIPLTGDGNFARAARARQPVIINGREAIMSTMAEFTEGFSFKRLIAPAHKMLNVHSVMLVPLIADNEFSGFIDLNRSTPFTEEDLQRIDVIARQITVAISRRRAEHALRLSEEKYRSLVEASDALVIMLDSDAVVQYANEKAAGYGSMHPEETIGKKLHELLPAETANIYKERVQKVIAANRGIVLETNPGNRWYRTSIQPVRDASGKGVLALINATDITELKNAQQELLDLNRSLELRIQERTAEVVDLYDKAPTGYHSLDANGNLMMINQTELNWLGYSREELIGRPFTDFITPASRQTFQANFPTFKQRGWVRDLEFEVIRKDGSTFPILVGATAIYDADGNYMMSRSTVFDNTERRKAEQALRESEETYRALFEGANDAIFLLDLNSRFARVNPRCPELLGFERADELIGRRANEFIDPSQIDDAGRRMERLLAGERIPPYERRFIRKDGKPIETEITLSLLKDAAGQPNLIQSVVRDITQRKKAEETLRLANVEMERALRMKDEFLANMSHELRTPLNAVLGISESLAEQVAGPLNEKQLKYVQTITESGQHLLTLINDILDLAKINAGKVEMDMQKTDLASLAHSSLRMIREQAQKKNQEVILSVDESMAQAWADERRLKQILVNLLSNAVKFTPQGGRIGLEIQGDAADHILRFVVLDTGIGISKEDLSRLFQPFSQLDSGLTRGSQGTGLGLVLVSQMARLHGGSIHVESEPGKGSRFTLSIPWTPVTRTDRLKPVNATPAPGLSESQVDNRPLILLVEDTEAVTMMIHDYLDTHGYCVLTAKNGIEGIALAREYQPRLILMDVMMPDMDGLETTRRIRAEAGLEHTPIVALTALAMPGDRERCLEAGMNDYISKPIILKDLLTAIADHLAGDGRKEES